MPFSPSGSPGSLYFWLNFYTLGYRETLLADLKHLRCSISETVGNTIYITIDH